MSELPDELQALLRLAKDGHDPTDPAAQRRVRHAIAASLLLSSGSVASSSAFPEAAASNTVSLGEGALSGGAKATKATWVLFGSKLTTLAAGAAAVVGLSLASYQLVVRVPERGQKPGSEQPAAAAPARTMLPEPEAAATPAAGVDRAAATGTGRDEPAPTTSAELRARDKGRATTARSEAAKPTRSRKGRASAEDLAAEMALVRAASVALAEGDQAAALAALREHARRFASGSLRVERDGLSAIAECTQKSGPSDASAKRFLRMYPHSLMSARVTKACAVE